MIERWGGLCAWYLNASRDEKVHWILLLIFYMTMFGRGTYRPGTEELEDPLAMRRLNGLLHSISSYLLVLIDDCVYGLSDDIFLRCLSESVPEAGFNLNFCLPQMMQRVGSRSPTDSGAGLRVGCKRIKGIGMENWEASKGWYLTASKEERIGWLSGLVFNVSAFGRETSARGTVRAADTVPIRRINEFVHRLSAKILNLIEDDQWQISDDRLLGYIWLAASEVHFEWREYQPRPFKQPE